MPRSAVDLRAQGGRRWRHLVVLVGCWCCSVRLAAARLRVGFGKGDGTGPIRSYVMMGMANPAQKGTGLHLRLYSRAVVFVDDATGARAAFVCVDGGMIGHVLKKRALERANLTDLYSFDNTIVSGTHTHSGPSGFLQHEIFQLAGSGWVPAVVDAMAEGIATALQRAHADVEQRLSSRARESSSKDDDVMTVGVAKSVLRNASINRSPTAYLANPAAERAAYDSDTDDDFFTLAVAEDEDATAGDSTTRTLRGAATWFAVHGTSMNNTNTLVSSDNKGLASLLAERDHYPGAVVAFASANLGDVSPNILGAFCRDSGAPCDVATSTCPEERPFGDHDPTARNEQCSARGPGADMFASTRLIADRQLDLARAMIDDFLDHGESTATTTKAAAAAYEWLDLSNATVETRHTFVTMPGLEVFGESGTKTNATRLGALCVPAMGQAFAAGTIDGPGMFDFAQAATAPNALWKVAADVLARGVVNEKKLAACHRPKPVLLPTGLMREPHPWAPTVLPIQLVKIGALVIAAPPTELTTMAGRRLKRALEAIFGEDDEDDVVVVIAGLSNEYADYTTTREEYGVQRYEGASTIYGPLQLEAYVQEFGALARAIRDGTPVPPGDAPEDFSADLDARRTGGVGLFPALGLDERPPRRGAFGDLLAQSTTTTNGTAVRPGDVVTAAFVGADPNRDPKRGATYLEVQRWDDAAQTWVTRFVDADPETRLSCVREKTYYRVTVRFDVPDDDDDPSGGGAAAAVAGSYRILYHGDAPSASSSSPSSSERPSSSSAFTGVSDVFVVVADPPQPDA